MRASSRSAPQEAEAAVFSAPDRLVVGISRERKRLELGIWDLGTSCWVSRRPFDEPVGTLFASGNRAFSLYGYPKIVDLATGEIMQRWEHISTGSERAPFNVNGGQRQAAFDAVKFRLAVSTESGITVLAAPPLEDTR